MSQVFDILVIGAGPAGLAAGIEASRAGLRCVILDAGGIAHNISLFQRDMLFFSTPELLSIGGLPFVVPGMRPTSRDCVLYYRSVATHFGLDCRFFQRVLSVTRSGPWFAVRTTSGDLAARNVVIATGYYTTPKRISVPGESLPHVNHYYRDPLPYYRQRVLIVGGKNSAVEAALDLWRNGAEVTVAHRGHGLSKGIKYWILPDFENRVADGAITFLADTTVERFNPGSTLLRRAGGPPLEIPTDFAFVLIGYEADVEFLGGCGVEVDAETGAPVHDPATMETGVAGIYVAGGIVGGRFNNKVFIENGREHGKSIVASILRSSGASGPPSADIQDQRAAFPSPGAEQ